MSWAIPFLALLGPWVWFVGQAGRGNAVHRRRALRLELDMAPFLLAARRVSAAMNELGRQMSVAAASMNAALSAQIQAEIELELGDILGDGR